MMCNCTVSGIYESIPLEWLEIVFKIYEISYFLGKPVVPWTPYPRPFWITSRKQSKRLASLCMHMSISIFFFHLIFKFSIISTKFVMKQSSRKTL